MADFHDEYPTDVEEEEAARQLEAEAEAQEAVVSSEPPPLQLPLGAAVMQEAFRVVPSSLGLYRRRLVCKQPPPAAYVQLAARAIADSAVAAEAVLL